MIISENKMDHSEMPALADGLTAGYDKQNWGMNLNLHRKIPVWLTFLIFERKNAGSSTSLALPVATAIVMPGLPGNRIVIQNILGVVKSRVTIHSKTFGSDLKYKEV